jgi:hypothetical protein
MSTRPARTGPAGSMTTGACNRATTSANPGRPALPHVPVDRRPFPAPLRATRPQSPAPLAEMALIPSARTSRRWEPVYLAARALLPVRPVRRFDEERGTATHGGGKSPRPPDARARSGRPDRRRSQRRRTGPPVTRGRCRPGRSRPRDSSMSKRYRRLAPCGRRSMRNHPCASGGLDATGRRGVASPTQQPGGHAHRQTARASRSHRSRGRAWTPSARPSPGRLAVRHRGKTSCRPALRRDCRSRRARAENVPAQVLRRGHDGTLARLSARLLAAATLVAVFRYHAGLPILGGGYVGLDAFFTLSVLLIAGLLKAQGSHRTDRPPVGQRTPVCGAEPI